MPKIFTSKHQKIGELGEKIATSFLIKQRFSIIERNYTKPWGEIDIIAKKKNKIYFIEVKSVTEKPLNKSSPLRRETTHTPEENMHQLKINRLSRTIRTYLADKGMTEESEWQFDLIVIILNFEKRKAKIKLVKDIILC